MSEKKQEREAGTGVRFLAALGLIVTTMVWGGSFVAMKTSVEQVPPTWLLAFRFTLAAFLMGLLFVKQIRSASRGAWAAGGIAGVFMELAYLFQTYGLKYTTASKNAFITTLYVVFVPFLLWIFLRKRPQFNQAAAAVLAVVGLALLSLKGDRGVNLGDGLTVLSGVCFAAHMILIDRFTKRHDPFFLTFVQTGTMAVLSWCLAPVLDGGILYLAVLATTGGFVLQNLGQKYLSANTASILLSLESVFGALFSVWLLHERMTGRMVLGCGLMFAAVLLAEVKFEQVVVYCRKAQRS